MGVLRIVLIGVADDVDYADLRTWLGAEGKLEIPSVIVAKNLDEGVALSTLSRRTE